MSKRLKLLTYPMALSTRPPPASSIWEHNKEGNSEEGGAGPSSALQARRWVRNPSELCVVGMYRHSRLLTEYVTKYKFDDPQWRQLLELPCGNPMSLELRARHCNIALRHIVQKGHAMYFITHAQHSVLHPRGLIEQSHVTCSIGVKGERLRTHIVHEGPLSATDRNGPRGVVGVSQVEGYGTWFQRKPMLWMRSRRIGALQAHLGAYDWELLAPGEVGKEQDYEVMLLGGRHTRTLGGGLSTTGIIASSSIAQHPYLYLGEFDTPATTMLDAVQQAVYKCCSSNRLIKGKEKEKLHAIAWTTRTPPPFVPLEADLPFQMHVSRPAMYENRSQYPSTVVGSPFLDGAPVMMTEYGVRQGAEHYLYDESPASRPFRWWSQPSNTPFNGVMWLARDGVVDNLKPCEVIDNPFCTESRKKPLHRTVAATERAKQRVKRYQKKAEQQEGNKKKSSS